MKTFQSFHAFRRTSALLLVCILMLSLSGCGRNNASTTAAPQESTAASEADSSSAGSGESSSAEAPADSTDSSENIMGSDDFDGTVGDNGVIGDALDDMETAVSEIGSDIEDGFRESTSAQAR